MGEARLREELEAQKCLLDFDAVRFSIQPGDLQGLVGQRAVLSQSERTLAHIRVAALVSRVMIESAFGAKMDGKDGRKWAAWLEVFSEEMSPISVPFGLVLWLRKYVCDETLGIPPSLASWRFSWADYLSDVGPRSEPEG